MVQSAWIDPPAIQVPPELSQAIGGHPLVAELLARKGITTPDAALAFLNPRYYRPTPPLELPDAGRAVERLARAIREHQPVVVWGDFDVDGQTATAIMFSALHTLGASVRFYVPHRQEESRGLNLPALKELLEAGMQVLVTCDCGVGDLVELQYLRDQGVDVIVTDHHDMPSAPVPALAVVNPKRLPPAHPCYSLAGAGVAYKLAEGLFEHFGRGRMVEQLADLVALGTIADVVPLLQDNRYLVQIGLPRLASGRRVGLRALLNIGGIELSDIDTTPVMYELAPALNAVGRLAHAELAVRLLLTEDKRQAEEWAVEILGLNEERRYQTNLAMSMAMERLEAMPRPLPPAIVLANRQWHPGVVGIVAGRLAEMYHRPAVIISIGPDGMARGSARSVPGIDIHQAILQQKDLLIAEGGHPMAAGFSLREIDLDEFTHRFIQTVRHMTTQQVLEHTLLIDAWVRWDELSLALYDDLARLAPFGEGNPSPILAARSLTLASIETVGERREHYRLRLTDEAGISHEVVWFNGDRDLLPQGPLDLAFTLRQNLYGGTRRMQIELVAVRRTPAAPITVAVPEHTVEVLDLRASPEAVNVLQHWAERAAAGESIALWGEGRSAGAYPFLQRRDQLPPAETLVIWSVPPGPDEFSAALEKTMARRLVLLYGDCPPADLRSLLLDLMGLVKHTLRTKRGEASLTTLAGVIAQRPEAVLLGLELLSDLDVCMFERIGEDGLFFLRYRPQTVHWADVITSPISSSLRRLLDETAAYRRFQLQARVEQVLPAGFRLNASPHAKV